MGRRSRWPCVGIWITRPMHTQLDAARTPSGQKLPLHLGWVIIIAFFFFFLQTGLFAHSSRNIIMSVIFCYQGYHWPSLFWLIRIKGDKFICAILVQSINLNGMLQSISQEKHFHLYYFSFSLSSQNHLVNRVWIPSELPVHWPIPNSQ
uniref:Uncharacterized protein n=1 Tax=Varanus komodoensis TaxID=61221 RepID=A0A8D2J2V5_VARKO